MSRATVSTRRVALLPCSEQQVSSLPPRLQGLVEVHGAGGTSEPQRKVIFVPSNQVRALSWWRQQPPYLPGMTPAPPARARRHGTRSVRDAALKSRKPCDRLLPRPRGPTLSRLYTSVNSSQTCRAPLRSTTRTRTGTRTRTKKT